MHRKIGTGLVGLLLGLFLLGQAAPSQAQESQVTLTELQFFVVGMDITPNPEKQAVPKDITTTVNADVRLAAPGINFADIQDLLPDDLVVKGELRGPAYPNPLTLTTKPNVPFTLPTLPIVGIYTLENIRMESSGETIAAAVNVVTIESFEKALVTQVTTRPLTIEEIQEAGILIDTSNFNVINFTAGITFQSNPIQIQFPVLIPTTPIASAYRWEKIKSPEPTIPQETFLCEVKVTVSMKTHRTPGRTTGKQKPLLSPLNWSLHLPILRLTKSVLILEEKCHKLNGQF